MAPGNREAVDWIDRWPDWPGHALALFGPAACGKTHLAQVFALRARARILDSTEVATAAIGEIVAAHKALVLENGEAVAAPEALFHLFNAVRESGGFLLLTSREPPARWHVDLPDLKSRLAAVPAVRIASPDDAMIEAVLVKLFADRQLAVAPEVIAYLVRHMDRSFAAMRSLVARADALALAEKRPVTVPLVKSLLEA
ncbi:MAG: HdaA/DnaA family protein [Rhodospirillaceae bacterium]